jgi:hypothetical protein
MNYVRPYPLSSESAGYLSAVGSSVNSHNLTAGKGIRIVKTSTGHQIYVQTEPHKECQAFQGTYNFSSEYFPNDTVYVDPTSSYLDQNGNPLIIQTGYYQCLVHVPGYDSVFFLSSVVPAYTSIRQTPTDYDANSYRWYANNKYYPQQTYTGTSSLQTVSGYHISSGVQFWQFLGGGSSNLVTTFNETGSYNVGDFVVVDINAAYSNSLIPNTSSTVAPMCAGFFQCRFAVPVTGSRPAGTIYYPIYPTIPSSSMVVVSGSIMNNYCWTPIVPELPVCVPPYGQVFIAMQVTSSMLSFPSTQLPYPL